MRQYFEYRFEWDLLKAHANIRKHGVTFEKATTVFTDPNALSVFDEESSQEEERWISLGLDRSGIPLVVCHTYRNEGEHGAHIRIISARKASKNELVRYKERSL